MKNPSEEIVTAWLQECRGYFTMNNIKVPKKGGCRGPTYSPGGARRIPHLLRWLSESIVTPKLGVKRSSIRVLWSW
jgi:hypothetical protein